MHVSAHLDIDLVAHETDENVTCLIQLVAPQTEATLGRPGQTLMVVLDRSGSMMGQRLENAKAALRGLLERFAPQDRFGLVVFDNNAEVRVPLLPMSDHDLPSVIEVIDAIRPGGTTDLSAGYALGQREIRRALKATQEDSDVVDSATLILISDGHANAGERAPEILREQAFSTFARDAVTTTTIGLGLGYDEELLAAIADGGSGTHVFAQDADDLPGAIAQEIDGLLDKSVLAATLRITGRDGLVDSVSTLQGLPSWNEGETVVLALGDLYAGEERTTLIRFDVGSIPALGLATIADVILEYTALPEQLEHQVMLPISVNVVPGDVAAQRVPKPEVVVERLLLDSAQAKASAALNVGTGDIELAQAALNASSSEIGAFCSAIEELQANGNLDQATSVRLQLRLRGEVTDLSELAAETQYESGARSRKNLMASSTNLRRGRSKRE